MTISDSAITCRRSEGFTPCMAKRCMAASLKSAPGSVTGQLHQHAPDGMPLLPTLPANNGFSRAIRSAGRRLLMHGRHHGSAMLVIMHHRHLQAPLETLSISKQRERKYLRAGLLQTWGYGGDRLHDRIHILAVQQDGYTREADQGLHRMALPSITGIPPPDDIPQPKHSVPSVTIAIRWLMRVLARQR